MRYIGRHSLLSQYRSGAGTRVCAEVSHLHDNVSKSYTAYNSLSAYMQNGLQADETGLTQQQQPMITNL